jgi:ABC-2 type transport system ATP-binding protein
MTGAPGPEPDGIRLERVSKTFGALTAVDDLSLSVRAGEIYGLIGPNGSGKTTTVRMLTGLYRPTAGRITVAGVDLAARPAVAKRALGYVPDEPVLYERLSGWEFLHLMGELYGVPRALRQARIERLLDLFPLAGVLDGVTGAYSRGNKQKLVILAALLHEPRVLVVDEPIVGLDPESALAVRSLVREFAEGRGGAVFVCTHTLAFAEAVCHRVGLLRGGRLVAEGDLSTLRQQSGLPGASLEALYLHLARVRLAGGLEGRAPLAGGAET